MRAHQHVRPLHQLELPSKRERREARRPWPCMRPRAPQQASVAPAAPGCVALAHRRASSPRRRRRRLRGVGTRRERHPRRPRPAARRPATKRTHHRMRVGGGERVAAAAADVARIPRPLSTAPWHERAAAPAKHDGVAEPFWRQLTRTAHHLLEELDQLRPATAPFGHVSVRALPIAAPSATREACCGASGRMSRIALRSSPTTCAVCIGAATSTTACHTLLRNSPRGLTTSRVVSLIVDSSRRTAGGVAIGVDREAIAAIGREPCEALARIAARQPCAQAGLVHALRPLAGSAPPAGSQACVRPRGL